MTDIDLEHLAETVRTNGERSVASLRKSRNAQRRLTVLAVFVLFAFLALSYRIEHNSRLINFNTRRIIVTQQLTCTSTLEVQRKFNRQQDALVAIERTDGSHDPAIRRALIDAYNAARIFPLPICDTP